MAGVNKFIQKFNNIADDTESKLKKNPFSDTFEQPDYDTQASDYGRPPKGSLTEKRGIKAGAYILNEVVHLCEIIAKYGEGPDECKTIKFGPLFKIYEFYSDKVVGLLIRARKYKLLDFDGEMLYQRQDDHKPIVMLMSMQEIYNIKYSGDPKNVIQVQNEGQPKILQKSSSLTTAPADAAGKDQPKIPKVKKFAKPKFTPGEQPRSSYYNFATGAV